MGGNAIKKFVEPVRVNKQEYQKVVDVVLTMCNSYNGITVAKDLKTFENKTDFGDLDVMIGYDSNFNRGQFEEFVNQQLNNSEFTTISNGPVSSFVYKLENGNYFQVDLFYVKQSEYEMCYAYHGNGDLGNFLGRIYHSLGLKFGHTGLIYIHRNQTYVVGEILLSNNFSDILDFIGLDIADTNFASIEDVYDFVGSSPFFSTHPFQFENRDHASRVRDRKRVSYTNFLKYMETEIEEVAPIAGKDYYMVAIKHFGKQSQYNFLVQKETERLAVKTLLNSSFIKRVSGLEDKKLGDLMQHLKSLSILSAKSIIGRKFNENRDIVVREIERFLDEN